jgi:hypothetical protein
MNRLASLCWWIAAAVPCLSCAEVAPYDRGRLAHPTMAPDDAASLGLDHVRALHEGAAGGELSASSGCGCN